MTAREQAEIHIFGQIVGKEIGDALIDGDVRRLTETIQSAILAEREACAKIAEKVSNESEICAKRSTGMREKRLFTGGKIACDSVVSKIRARSNAPEISEDQKRVIPHGMKTKFIGGLLVADPTPEIENKAPESPENLQVSTYPASILKTCT